MERSAILSRIQGILGDRSRPGLLDETQVFCIEDGEPIPRVPGVRTGLNTPGMVTSGPSCLTQP